MRVTRQPKTELPTVFKRLSIYTLNNNLYIAMVVSTKFNDIEVMEPLGLGVSVIVNQNEVPGELGSEDYVCAYLQDFTQLDSELIIYE